MRPSIQGLRWLLVPLALWVVLDVLSYALPLLSILVGPPLAWFWVAVVFLAGPLWALLLFRTGHHLRGWLPAHARALQVIAGASLLGAAVTVVQCWGDADALRHHTFFLVGRQLMFSLSFAVLGLAVARIRGRGRGWLPWLNGLVNLPGMLLVLALTASSGVEDWFFIAGIFWLIVPTFAGVVGAAALSRELWPSSAEQVLRRAAERDDALQLREDSLPIRVRRRIPCHVPYGLRVSSPGEGVTLHNAVLDQLLELSTTAPAAVASIVSENEDTVLALLHRFPDSHLEEDAVVFEASAELLVEEAKGRPVTEVVAEGVEAAEGLAALLEGG